MSYSMPLALRGLGTVPVSQQELGQIQAKDGYTYQVTPNDLLWLARSAKCEGGDPASTVWTYAQRQAFYRRSSSLASLVQAHSQPVNPAWDEASDPKCVQHPDRCTPAMLARRRACTTMSWEAVPGDIREIVLKWATAQLPNPAPKSVDFADEQVSQSFMRRNPGTKLVKKSEVTRCPQCNWYLSYPPSLRGGSQHWDPDFVTMKKGSRVAGPAAGAAGISTQDIGLIAGVSLVGASALFAGWAYWKYGRRS